MNLIIIFGPHAVGKMTVGQELSKITQIPLFHNHKSIELALELLGSNADHWHDLSSEIREVVFKHVAKANDKGLIFTFMWALDLPEDHDYIAHLESIFEAYQARIIYVELYADRDVRLLRNQSENRLNEKPSKRNIEESMIRLNNIEEKYRLNTMSENELKKKNYMKIDNTHVEPKMVAHMIKERFQL